MFPSQPRSSGLRYKKKKMKKAKQFRQMTPGILVSWIAPDMDPRKQENRREVTKLSWEESEGESLQVPAAEQLIQREHLP